MKITAKQLPHALQTLTPLIILSGADPLLIQESRASICQAARQRGFTAHRIVEADAHLDMQTVAFDTQQGSLFDSKQLIEIRFSQSKIDEKTAKILVDCAHRAQDHSILLLIFPKFDQAIQKTKAFQLLDRSGLIIQVWPIDRKELPQWISARLRAHQLPCAAEIVTCLATQTEGNLLATQQLIEKLNIVHQQTPLSVADCLAMITQANQYTVFDWVEACLLGELTRALRILQQLRQEKTEATLLVWSMMQELSLLSCAFDHAHFTQFAAEKKLWPKRQTALQRYLAQHSRQSVYHHVQLVAAIDRAIKGASTENPWLLLAQFSGELCHYSMGKIS